MSEIQDIYTNLNQLKSDYSNELEDKIIQDLLNINKKVLFESKTEDFDGFNGQNDSFYDKIALNFVKSIENDSISYFFEWYYILKFYNQESLQTFFSRAFQHAIESPARSFIMGITNYYNKNYEDAISNFAECEEFVADYFIGHAHYFTDNYKDCIAFYDNFINGVENKYIDDFDKLDELSTFEWICFVNTGNAYAFTKFFEEGMQFFNDSMDLLPLEEGYKQIQILRTENKRFDFALYLANYIKTLSKGANVERYNELVDFAKEKYPESSYFQKVPYAVAAPK